MRKLKDYFQICKSRARFILSNITIEPLVFLVAFSGTLDNISYNQLKIDKSCLNDFNFTQEICDNLLEDNYTAQNDLVDDAVHKLLSNKSFIPNFIECFMFVHQVAQLEVYSTVLTGVFPAFFAFYLGAWSDIFGRKFLLFSFVGAKITSQIFLILNVQYMEWPKEWLLLVDAIPAMVGKNWREKYSKANEMSALTLMKGATLPTRSGCTRSSRTSPSLS